MGRRWTEGQGFFRRALAIAGLSGLILLTLGVGSALAAQVITSAGPLNSIYVNNDLGCQATHTGDALPEFFGSTPGACGTFLAVPGVGLYGPSIPAPLTPTPYTLVSQSGVTGAGTAASPYQVATTVAASGSGLSITETDSYVVGQEQYQTAIAVHNNNSSGTIFANLYHAGDCYLQGSDSGYGWFDPTGQGIYCTANPNNSPAGRIIGFHPMTSGYSFVEGFYASVWGDMGPSVFPDTCDCTTFEDNGAGLSWPLAVPAGGTATFSLSTIMSPSGSTTGTPNPTATAPAVAPGPTGPQSSTAATFNGTVNPNGASTTADFQYGLDPSYTGGGPVNYTGQVLANPPNPVGSDFTTHPVTGRATGLVPNALYHVRLVASNGLGTTFGPDQTFRTQQDPAPTAPALGQVNAAPVSGTAYVKLPGSSGALSAHATSSGPGFIPLTEARKLPAGTQFDTRAGTIKLTNATGKKKGKKLQNATLGGAIFSFSQARSGKNKGLTTLKVLEGAFSGAASYASCTAKKADAGAQLAAAGGPLAQIAVSKSVLSTLKVRSSGKYSSRGHYGSATARATAWTIKDRCDGTLISVQKDVVVVRDFVRHKTITLHAGQHYLAKK